MNDIDSDLLKNDFDDNTEYDGIGVKYIINSQPKIEKKLNNGWIPCSERLPQYTDDYNVTVGVGCELGYFEEVRIYRYEIYNGKESYKKWIIPNNVHEVVCVIAWQPLPEPYKEESNDV